MTNEQEVNASGAPRVLRIITRLNIGGPARHVVILHNGLAERGWSTRLVYGSIGPGEGSFESLLAGALPAEKIASLGPRVDLLRDLSALLRVTRTVFRERPDVLHTHTAKAGTLGRLAAIAYNATRRRRNRCLVVHTFHGNVLEGYFGPVASRIVQGIERLLAAATDRIVTISPTQEREITSRFRIAPRERVSIIRLGLDLHTYFGIGGVVPAVKVDAGFPCDAVVFACAGRLVPIKNLPVLLRALALARERAGSTDLRLLVAGDGEEREHLETLARSLHLEEAVRFLGWRSDLDQIYQGVDAVVLSSRNEGTPVTLIEAMAAGRPVIATQVGGVPDVVADGEEGLLVPADDPARLADAMVRLARSPEERRRMGARGRVTAARYTESHLLDAVSALYCDGLAQLRGQATSLQP